MPTVLIVVDDDTARGLMASQLTLAGYDVHTAADGRAGLSVIEALLPDLVVLGWMLPKLSAVEVCARVRANPKLRRVVVVLLASNCQEDDVQRGFASGADDYLVTPLSPRELVWRVETLLAAKTEMKRAVS